MSTSPDVPSFAIVIPTLRRPSLARLLDSLVRQEFDATLGAPSQVIIVDDRRDVSPATIGIPGDWPWAVCVVRGYGRGPAAARNRGWRLAARAGAEWIAFLDDDVELPPGWITALAADLGACGPQVAASQGRITVPLPSDRGPTDWERNTAALETAAWATADMAYRAAALRGVGGFDERFPRAYREDADLALRVRAAGWTMQRGERFLTHPVRPAGRMQSVRVQAGNADDALMRRLHGRDWRARADVPRGTFRRHAVTVGALAGSAVAAVAAVSIPRRVAPGAGRSSMATAAAAVGMLAWVTLTTAFTVRRMRPGPRPGEPGFAGELARMTVTSAAIPLAAVRHRVAGELRSRSAMPWPPPVRAVLFDRDGTLVHDVPYNGDPRHVAPVDDAAEALAVARRAGLRTAVVSNQSGIGRGLITRAQVDAVNERVDALLGPFDSWQVCPHVPDDRCDCRKPAPGMVLAAARALRLDPAECVMIGDIGADIEAASAAGARSILIPTPITRADEIAAAGEVAGSLSEAVQKVLDGL